MNPAYELCHCGSGKKNKWCHNDWRHALSATGKREAALTSVLQEFEEQIANQGGLEAKWHPDSPATPSEPYDSTSDPLGPWVEVRRGDFLFCVRDLKKPVEELLQEHDPSFLGTTRATYRPAVVMYALDKEGRPVSGPNRHPIMLGLPSGPTDFMPTGKPGWVLQVNPNPAVTAESDLQGTIFREPPSSVSMFLDAMIDAVDALWGSVVLPYEAYVPSVFNEPPLPPVQLPAGLRVVRDADGKDKAMDVPAAWLALDPDALDKASRHAPVPVPGGYADEPTTASFTILDRNVPIARAELHAWLPRIMLTDIRHGPLGNRKGYETLEAAATAAGPALKRRHKKVPAGPA